MSPRMLRPAATFAVASTLALGLLFGACGGDDDDGGDSADQALIDAMVSEGATEEQARCFIDELGDDADRIYGADEDDLSEEDLERALQAFQDCGAFEEE